MIRETSSNQEPLSQFGWPFQNALDPQNRWVRLAHCVPWDALSEAYLRKMNPRQGRPSIKARVVIGALIIKHKLVLSDRETVGLIQENPYMQYFIGLESYTSEKPFDASLFVRIRRRMGQSVFDEFTQSIIEEMDHVNRRPKECDNNADDNEPPSGAQRQDEPDEVCVKTESIKEPKQGKLIVDATVADQAIRFPTDVSLLNEAREFCEQIIDWLYKGTELRKKPRTYRQNARRDYLSYAKRRKPTRKIIRKAIRQQLQYVRRDLEHIERLLEHYKIGSRLPMPNWLLRRYWVIPHLYEQQKQMYDEKVNRCDKRIVSISQPWVRPIVRGKQHKPTEFGAKINVSMNDDGVASIDYFSWEAFNESQNLQEQVEAYRERHGYYPKFVLADPIYGTRDNRGWLKEKGIRFGGKPLGRPRKPTEQNAEQLKAEKKQRHEDYRQRIPIEGKFGQGKSGYRLNYIRTKRSDTSQAWINSILFVMNLIVLYVEYFLRKFRSTMALVGLKFRLWRCREACEWEICSVPGNRALKSVYRPLRISTEAY